MGDRRYTREEARQLDNMDYCGRMGHSWSMTMNMAFHASTGGVYFADVDSNQFKDLSDHFKNGRFHE